MSTQPTCGRLRPAEQALLRAARSTLPRPLLVHPHLLQVPPALAPVELTPKPGAIATAALAPLVLVPVPVLVPVLVLVLVPALLLPLLLPALAPRPYA